MAPVSFKTIPLFYLVVVNIIQTSYGLSTKAEVFPKQVQLFRDESVNVSCRLTDFPPNTHPVWRIDSQTQPINFNHDCMAYPMSSFGSFPIESLSVTCSPGADLNAGGSLMWLNMTVKTKGQWYSNGRPMFYCALLANPEGVDVTLLDRVTTGQLVSKPMVRSDQTLKPEVQIKFTCDTGTNNNECQYTKPTIQWIVGQKEITEGVVNNPVDCGGNPPKYRTSSDINISGDQFNGVQDVKCVVKMKDRIDESATKTITVKFPEAKTGAENNKNDTNSKTVHEKPQTGASTNKGTGGSSSPHNQAAPLTSPEIAGIAIGAAAAVALLLIGLVIFLRNKRVQNENNGQKEALAEKAQDV